MSPFDQIDPPHDLTLPLPGSTTSRTILSRAIRRLLFDLKQTGLHSGAWLGKDTQTFQHLIAGTLKYSPGALASALCQPSIGTLLRCLRTNTTLSKAHCIELFALLTLELARRHALPPPNTSIVLYQFPKRLLCPGGRFVFIVPSDTQSIRFENGLIHLESPGNKRSIKIPPDSDSNVLDCFARAYYPIEESIVLALEDNNPLAMLEAHPNKSGNAIDLGAHPPQEWTASLISALGLIHRYLPDFHKEIHLFIHQFIPVGYDNERHLSASYQEAIGTIYLSLHPHPMTMTEAVIHEFSHNKINALFELDPVLENAWSPLYASPVRPDLRPLHGIVLAAHAFLPVAELYRAMIRENDPLAAHPSFLERFRQIRAKNHEAVTTLLAHGRPTPAGQALLDELKKLDQIDD